MTPRRKGHGRRKLPNNLPVDERHLRPPRCKACGSDDLREVGTEVTSQLDHVPSYFLIRRIVRQTCACRACGQMTTATAPPSAIDKGACTAPFLAWLGYSKYGLHLPLERLRGELRRQGVDASMSTMCGWIAAQASLLAPLVGRFKHHLLASGVVNTDGTGLQVLRRGQRKAHLGQMAVYCSSKIAVFDYTPTKEGKYAAAFLHRYKGVLVADAASTFDQLYKDGRIVEAGCWAHARRKFEEAVDHSAAAHEAIAFIADLYQVEHDARERGLELGAARAERTRPILAALEAWLTKQAEEQLPKSPVGKAVAYVRRHWIALTRFPSDARLPLDNNLAERQLRSVAVGRANYVFAGSDAGAEYAAVLYSVVQTCKLNDVDPYAGSPTFSTVSPCTPRTDGAAVTASTTSSPGTVAHAPSSSSDSGSSTPPRTRPGERAPEVVHRALTATCARNASRRQAAAVASSASITRKHGTEKCPQTS